MKSKIVSETLVFTILFSAIAYPAIAASNADEEKALRKVEAMLCAAFQNSDADVIARFEDEHYTLTNSRGLVTGRAQDVDEARKRDPKYDVFRNHDQKIRFYGDAAIINGITTAKGSSGGTAFDADFQYTDTYIKRDGQWILASSHATKIERKP